MIRGTQSVSAKNLQGGDYGNEAHRSCGGNRNDRRTPRRSTGDLRIAFTQKNLSSLVFSFGRDHGLFGRILNQTVIPVGTLTVNDGKEVIGFSFTPQDGNSLLSSIAAAEWFLYPEDYEQRLRCIEEHCFSEI